MDYSKVSLDELKKAKKLILAKRNFSKDPGEKANLSNILTDMEVAISLREVFKK